MESNNGKNKNIHILILVLVLIVVALVVTLILVLNSNDEDKNKDVETDDTKPKEEEKVEEEKVEAEKSIKLDDSLDYVYDAEYKYDNKYIEFKVANTVDSEEKITDFGIEVTYTKGTQYLSNLKVPYININSSDASTVNKELEELYLEYAKQFDACAKNKDRKCSQILTYQTYLNDDILSIVVIDSLWSSTRYDLNYRTYVFDLADGKLLKYNDILNKLGYNKDTTLTIMEAELRNKVKEVYPDSEKTFYCDCSCYCTASCADEAVKLLNDSINNDTINVFVNDEGVLSVLAIPYYDGTEFGISDKFLLEIRK